MRGPDGDYQVDPDEQVQSVVCLIFDVFERQGSLHGLLRWLKAHDVRMPVRPHFGPNRGQLEWRRPNRMTLQNLLHHPIYAGAYRWGHRKMDPRRQQPGRRSTGRTINAPEQCEVLLKDRFAAYIAWDRFAAIQKRLADNRAVAEAMGAPREGSSLLAGLLVCARCERHLTVCYGGPHSYLRYSCSRAVIDYGQPVCQSLSGQVLDDFVAEQALKVLKPAALELSLAAEAELRDQRQRLEEHWKQRLERAAFEGDRARRQYAAVEPENRLVARELERRWEEALGQQRQVEEDYDRFQRQQPEELTAAQRDAVMGLSREVPQLWHAETTTPQDRQEILRLLLDRVVVGVEGQSEQVEITLHWAGGFTSRHRLVRPVSRYEQLSNYYALCERMNALREQGCSSAEIARQLNAEGFHPPKRASQFSGGIVARLLGSRGLQGPRPQAMADPTLLAKHEFWLADLARHLGIPVATMHKWQRVGWVHSRKIPVAGGRWAIWADAEEGARLRRLRSYRRQWPEPRYPAALTTPKLRVESE